MHQLDNKVCEKLTFSCRHTSHTQAPYYWLEFVRLLKDTENDPIYGLLINCEPLNFLCTQCNVQRAWLRIAYLYTGYTVALTPLAYKFLSLCSLPNERRCLQVLPHYSDIFKRPDDLPLFLVLLCLLTENCGHSELLTLTFHSS